VIKASKDKSFSTDIDRQTRQMAVIYAVEKLLGIPWKYFNSLRCFINRMNYNC